MTGDAVGVGARVPNDPSMSIDRMREAQHEARMEAAPFLLAVVAAQCSVATLSAWRGWELLGRSDWWIWLLLAAPALVLSVAFLGGVGQAGDSRRRRAVADWLLVVLGTANLAGVGMLVACLVGVAAILPTGPQLLVSALAVLLTNVVTFALAFWETDCGGPVERALASERNHPDFQFPQDENPTLARQPWEPRLGDYFYVSLTNSVAFSPTDAMPLSQRAKWLMASESVISVVTVLVVTARAVNVLGA